MSEILLLERRRENLIAALSGRLVVHAFISMADTCDEIGDTMWHDAELLFLPVGEELPDSLVALEGIKKQLGTDYEYMGPLPVNFIGEILELTSQKLILRRLQEDH